MRVIWKVELPLLPTSVHSMMIIGIPTLAPPVHASRDFDTGVMCLWFEVDPQAPARQRKFVWVGPGQPVPEFGNHRATVVETPFVWHLYEVHES